MSFLRRLRQISLLLLTSSLLLGMGRPPGPDATDRAAAVSKELKQYRNDLLDYFKTQYLLPVVIPEGQSIGDIYEVEFWTLEDRAAKCFPTLSVTPAAKSELPNVLLTQAANAGWALGLASTLKLGGSARFDDKMHISFTDVSVRRVSKGDLRRSLNKKNCGYLEPIVEEQLSATAPVKAIFGKIVYAKKSVFIGLESQVNLEAEAAKIADLLAALAKEKIAAVRALSPEASLKFGFGAKQGVLIESKEILPVAFLPAFIPKPIFDQVRGEGGIQTQIYLGNQWAAFEPETTSDDRDTFDLLVKTIQP